MFFTAKARKTVGKTLYAISRTKHQSIPLDEIDAALRGAGYKLIQEDGEDYEGIFCGREGSATIRIADLAGELVTNSMLTLQWYFLTTKFEINAYMA
jgi:hypothetical protein